MSCGWVNSSNDMIERPGWVWRNCGDMVPSCGQVLNARPIARAAVAVLIFCIYSCIAAPVEAAETAQILGVGDCATLPLNESALVPLALERLHDEKTYRILQTALPRKSFDGHGKSLSAAGGSLLHTHQPLKGSEAHRSDIAAALETIIPHEFGKGKCPSGLPCDKGWADVRKRQNRIRYASSLVDLKHFRRRIYIDGGSRGFESSIDGWFNPVYPQSDTFDHIYAFEINPKFGETFGNKPGTTFLPCAIWTKDEKLPMFGKTMNTLSSKSHVSNKASKLFAYAVDFSNWLHQTVSPEDFVIIKLDIEGAEHEVLPYLLETKAIYLLDEIFVECHFNHWSQMRLDKTRQDCVRLMQGLRDKGILLHEWF